MLADMLQELKEPEFGVFLCDQRLREADFSNHLWLLNDSEHQNAASQGACSCVFERWMSSIHSANKSPTSGNNKS